MSFGQVIQLEIHLNICSCGAFSRVGRKCLYFSGDGAK